MALAFEELFNVPAPVDGISMAGRTDAWVLAALASARGVSPTEEQSARFRDAYLRHLPVELIKPGPRKGVMPGVRPLLDSLAVRQDVHLGLLTGNYEQSARVKLEYFDLWRYFHGGAFGDSAVDRNHLFDEAVASVASRGTVDVSRAPVIVIGDTPLDVQCAMHGGARSIAVATGNHSVEELRGTGADSVFEDLSDTRAVIAEVERLGGLDEPLR